MRRDLHRPSLTVTALATAVSLAAALALGGCAGMHSPALRFADGHTVPADAEVSWATDLETDDAWTKEPQGPMTFGSADGACEVSYWQGDTWLYVGGNDLETTQIIATEEAAGAPSISDDLELNPLSFQSRSGVPTDMLVLSGTHENMHMRMAIRGITTAETVLFVGVTCSNDTAGTVLDEVLSKSEIHIEP